MKNTVYLLIILLFFGCKYEDGPLFSLRTAEQRVERSWKFERVERNGLNVTNGYEGTGNTVDYGLSSIGFNGNNRFSEKMLNVIYGLDTMYSTYIVKDGTWSLEDNKKVLKLTYDASFGGLVRELDILKLKNAEMILEEELDGDVLYQYQMGSN